MSFNLLDAGVLAILLVSTILAYSRGIIAESVSVLGWIIALVVAGQFAYLLVPFVEGLPFIRDYVPAEDNCELLTVIAFVMLFIIMMIVMALITPLFTRSLQIAALGTIDSILGAIFGFARGALIVVLLFVFYDKFFAPSMKVDIIEHSGSYAMFKQPREDLQNSLPSQEGAPEWLQVQFGRVTKHCTGSAPNV